MSAVKRDVRRTVRPIAGVEHKAWKVFAMAGSIVVLLLLAGVGLFFMKPNGTSQPGPIAPSAETAVDSQGPPMIAARAPSIANRTTRIPDPKPVEYKPEILAILPRLFAEPISTANARPEATPPREPIRPETTLAPAVPIRIAPSDSDDERPKPNRNSPLPETVKPFSAAD